MERVERKKKRWVYTLFSFSGSPLTLKNEVVALVNAGKPCAEG